MRYLVATLCFLIGICIAQTCLAGSRYFYGGDGYIDIASGKRKASFKGRYRDDEGNYLPDAMAKLAATYGAPVHMMEPRFIEFLDYLQDEMKGGRITIYSGYRSPTYNTSLRNKGKLAGKASMHQYGMAADIRMKGLHPEKIWYFVRDLGYGGVGYYHGANAHVDVGPARFWDETSSKVGTDHADDNKLITLIPHQDIYRPGEEIKLRFVRMTAYPIGVSEKFIIEQKEDGQWKKVKTFKPTLRRRHATCKKLANIDEMKNIIWQLPSKIEPGRYRIRASFCEKEWQAMPESIASYEFEIRKP